MALTGIAVARAEETLPSAVTALSETAAACRPSIRISSDA
jgi:hypothetical protein